mgnify:CR=1 FL=1
MVVMGNHPAGLNALKPAEILHQMFLGVIEYALNGFVHLYSKKALSRFDNYARVVYLISIHNSDRTIPNLNCQYGYTSLTKKKGSDRVGICLTILPFVLLWIRQTTLHRQAFNKATHNIALIALSCVDEVLTHIGCCSIIINLLVFTMHA